MSTRFPLSLREGAVAVVAIVVIVGLAAAWLFFLGSEAPPAPTLDDALQVLQSAAPSE